MNKQQIEEAQNWEQLRKEPAQLIKLDNPRQLHPQFITIQQKAVFEEVVSQLGYKGRRGSNPDPKAGEWLEYVSTFSGTYYQFNPNFKPQKTAF